MRPLGAFPRDGAQGAVHVRAGGIRRPHVPGRRASRGPCRRRRRDSHGGLDLLHPSARTHRASGGRDPRRPDLCVPGSRHHARHAPARAGLRRADDHPDGRYADDAAARPGRPERIPADDPAFAPPSPVDGGTSALDGRAAAGRQAGDRQSQAVRDGRRASGAGPERGGADRPGTDLEGPRLAALRLAGPPRRQGDHGGGGRAGLPRGGGGDGHPLQSRRPPDGPRPRDALPAAGGRRGAGGRAGAADRDPPRRRRPPRRGRGHGAGDGRDGRGDGPPLGLGAGGGRERGGFTRSRRVSPGRSATSCASPG